MSAGFKRAAEAQPLRPVERVNAETDVVGSIPGMVVAVLAGREHHIRPDQARLLARLLLTSAAEAEARAALPAAAPA